MIVFFFFPKIFSSKVVHPSQIYQNTNFHGPTLSGEGFASPQKFERQQIYNGCSYSIKNDGLEAIINGMALILDFIKFTNWFRSL
jgi:hypothetical protein